MLTGSTITWDVLASSADEINQIAERLNQPSVELAAWIAERDQQSLSEVMEAMKRLLAFKTMKNLGVIAKSENKARLFGLAFKDQFCGIVNAHINEVSETFPKAIFPSNTSISRRATQASGWYAAWR